MKNKIFNLIICGFLLVILTGCESSGNGRDEFDNLLNPSDKPTDEKTYTTISCEEATYIDTKYYVYVKSGKYIARIEFDEETSSVHKYTLSYELTLANSATNDTLKEHAEEFNDYCKENNNGEFVSCTYTNSVESGKKTTIVGEYDLEKITNLPKSVAEAKKFLEQKHGMTCTIK